jgi:hypothetical protein
MIQWVKKGGLRVQILIVILAAVVLYVIFHPGQSVGSQFDGNSAFAFAQKQMDFGPRTPGSEAHAAFVDWAQQELGSMGWTTELQMDKVMNHPMTNIIAKKGTGSTILLLGAHYDSRLLANQDKSHPSQPVPGANDGASGVAVLMELARTLTISKNEQVWLVFFDVEDQGDIDGWDWCLGSEYVAQHLTVKPSAVVVVDMIGDSDLNILYEVNSDKKIKTDIWQIAEKLGYGKEFIQKDGFSMLDDHTPFLKVGIPAVDIIDFNYPYWHTTKDTLDKISAASLEKVGRTLQIWAETYQP